MKEQQKEEVVGDAGGVGGDRDVEKKAGEGGGK